MNKRKNKSLAFATFASGEMHERFKRNLMESLRKYVPSVDIIDMSGVDKIDLFRGVPEGRRGYLVRLAIPLLGEFSKYDKVVWVDVDADVISPEFGRIFDVETSKDGLAAAPDQIRPTAVGEKIRGYMKRMFAGWDNETYFNSGVLVFEMKKIDKRKWEERVRIGIDGYVKMKYPLHDQDILNAYFEMAKIDPRFNWLSNRGVDPINPAWCVHYVAKGGHEELDRIIETRLSCPSEISSASERCVVVSPRHDFIRSWIRAYFSFGNKTPLVIVKPAESDWTEEDMAYCTSAALESKGTVFEPEKCDLGNGSNFSNDKSRIIFEVAKNISPKSWAWIDDDVEISGNLDECFEYAERSRGSVCARFHYPGEDTNRHPFMLLRRNGEDFSRICDDSFIFFHGNANSLISNCYEKYAGIPNNEAVLCELYRNDDSWHEEFCDMSVRKWTFTCKRIDAMNRDWRVRATHYSRSSCDPEMRRMWSEKYKSMPAAPFEIGGKRNDGGDAKDPVDAVFVIGTGSSNKNEELRYALRDIERHCPFIRDVYICGFCPEWVDKTAVRHLQWPDRFSHAKDANIIDKLRHACEHPGIAKKILFCSDDQFQTRVCEWGDFEPRYLRRYASNDKWYEKRGRVWHTRLRKTLERDVQRRRSLGIDANDVFYFQPHMWMQIDRDLFIEYAKWCGYESRTDTIIASGYFNYIGEKGTPDFDHVFLGSADRVIPRQTHVAYHDGSYNAAMYALKQLFPERCHFEKVEECVKSEAEDANYDPSRATKEELGKIEVVLNKVRSNGGFNGLKAEISRAEEMRLSEARGWRVVWNDIITRCSAACKTEGCSGGCVNGRSDLASGIIECYLEARKRKSDKTTENRKDPIASERSELHERIRSRRKRNG